jgi:hypothetical protein
MSWIITRPLCHLRHELKLLACCLMARSGSEWHTASRQVVLDGCTQSHWLNGTSGVHILRPHQTKFYTSAVHRSPHRWNLTHTGLLLKPQQRTSPTYNCVFFSLVHDINIVNWRWPSTAETCSRYRRNKHNTKTAVFLTDPASFF